MEWLAWCLFGVYVVLIIIRACVEIWAFKLLREIRRGERNEKNDINF